MSVEEYKLIVFEEMEFSEYYQLKKTLMKSKLFMKGWMLTILAMISSQFAIAQINVSGTIMDELENEALIGVNILVKGTANGTITDIDGSYLITVPDANSVLVYSYTGYNDQEIVVGNQQVIDLKMDQKANALDEVVVVGYTTRKRGELTGSVSTVDAEVLERTANRDIVKSLAGRAPGLIINDRGGYTGSDDDVSILIRGKSTLGNNNPLILVDGIPSESFSYLNPSDIESISVLKDGAAAIYGARAANGVILITTKRGKSGAPTFNFTSSYTRSGLSSQPQLMSSEQFAIYSNEAAARNELELPYSTGDIAKYAAGNDPLFPSTDWYAATMADSSPEWRNTLSISGGNDKVGYFVSGDYLDQTGLFKSEDLNFKQYQLRSNIDIQLHDKVKLGVDVAGRFGDRNQPGVDESFIYKHIYTNFPTEVVTNPDGSYAWGGENGANPVLMSSSESGFVNRIDNNLRSKIALDVDLDWIVPGLSAQTYAGVRRWNTNTKSWYTPWTVYRAQAGTSELAAQDGFSQQGAVNILRERFWKFNELMLNGTLRYDKDFGNHGLKAMVGTERFTSNQSEFFAERRGFPSSIVPELFAGADEGQISDGGSAEWARLNYFGSLSYDFKKKYFVDLTLRRDGSSNFGPGNRFGTFPGIAIGWAIGEEGFMKNSGIFDALKLRASWALMGNDRINSFQWQTRYNFGGGANPYPNDYIFGTNGTAYNGYASANVPNPDITWETADMKNLGLNFAVLDFKLTGDFNYFIQKREDILITRNASIPAAAGLTLPQENLGKVDNFGWELQLGWNDNIGKVKYNLGLNYTQAKNEIVFIDEAADIADGLKQEGFPLDSYIVYPTNGLFENQAQIDGASAILEGTRPGDPFYVDTNGDGAIDAGDRTRVYSSNIPEVQYGFFAGVGIGGFDLNVLFQGQAGAETIVFFDQMGGLPEFVFTERWTPTNTNSLYPQARVQGDPFAGNLGTAEDFEAADLYLMDASFLRLKEVELGYTLSKEQLKFGQTRLFFRGLNLATFFSDIHDLGLDPEAARYDNFRDSKYPSLRAYTFGVNLTF